MKTILKIIGVLILITLIGVGYLYFTYTNITSQPLSDDSSKVRFEISEGMTGSDILLALSQKGLYEESSINYLKVYIKLNNVPTFKEGTYYIPHNLTVPELFELLQKPQNTDIWITIPEGLRVDEIATIIEKEYSENPESVFKKEEFLKLVSDKEYIASLELPYTNITTLEGLLFPDKYLMPVQATEDYLIRTLINNHLKKIGSDFSYKDLIIASMIEREGFTNQDRPMISDIIRRRLNEGWLLQIDATLLYYHKDWKHVILATDKEIDHPYNTYKKVGLPPTPICNPGLSAIQASKNPQSNNYYYYLHDNTRAVHYGKTYQDHLNNISKYLR